MALRLSRIRALIQSGERRSSGRSPDFDPDAWVRRLPPLDLFGALVFAVIGQQISVTAATALLLATPG